MDDSRRHMAAQLPGNQYAKFREKLQPHYAVGCQRLIITDDYFPVFTQDNVRLETSQIREITPNGVAVEGDREHEFDLLVLATGFKTTQFMYPIKIFGSEGKSIEDIWSSGAFAYLGMTVPLLPNFSMLYGPNTNLGHNSIILMIDAQALYIDAIIRKVKTAQDRGCSISVEPKSTVAQAYNDEIQARLSKSAFADPNCHSWYKNEAGLITNNWSDAVIPYQKRTSIIDGEDFEVNGSGAEECRKEGKATWRGVTEETQNSNSIILMGLITATGAVAAGAALSWNARKSLLRH